MHDFQSSGERIKDDASFCGGMDDHNTDVTRRLKILEKNFQKTICGSLSGCLGSAKRQCFGDSQKKTVSGETVSLWFLGD